MQFILESRLFDKTCPHCGACNNLRVIDLLRSIYTDYEPFFWHARHYCHHCKAGWNVRLMPWWHVVWILLIVYGLLSNLDLLANWLLPKPLENWIYLASLGTIKLSAIVLIFMIFDFSIKTLIIKISPLDRQT
jgi:hypothetical protein